MSNAPSFWQSDSPPSGSVPNWNDAGWVYKTALLSTTDPGFEDVAFYTFSCYDFGAVVQISRLTLDYHCFAGGGGHVYTSIDGTNWTVQYGPMPASFTQSLATVDHTFATPLCCRYIVPSVPDDQGGSPANTTYNFYCYDPDGNPVFAVRAGTPTAPVALAASLAATNGAVSGISPNDTLTWSSAGANTVTLDDGTGPVVVAASGSMVVSPTHDTTYTIAASTCAGTVTSTATVKYLAVPTLTATPSLPSNVPTVELQGT